MKGKITLLLLCGFRELDTCPRYSSCLNKGMIRSNWVLGSEQVKNALRWVSRKLLGCWTSVPLVCEPSRRLQTFCYLAGGKDSLVVLHCRWCGWLFLLWRKSLRWTEAGFRIPSSPCDLYQRRSEWGGKLIWWHGLWQPFHLFFIYSVSVSPRQSVSFLSSFHLSARHM